MKASKSKVLFNTWVIDWNLKQDKQHIKGGLFFDSMQNAKDYIKGIKASLSHEQMYLEKGRK